MARIHFLKEVLALGIIRASKLAAFGTTIITTAAVANVAIDIMVTWPLSGVAGSVS